MRPVAGARLTLINPGPTAAYSGMLPGYVAGHYDRPEIEIDLVALSRFAGARLVLGSVEALDPVNRTIRVAGRPDIGYDVASVDIGITSEMPSLRGFSEHGVPAKPLGAFAAKWREFLETGRSGQVAVIGAGIAGVELALAMAHALRTRARDPRVTLIDRSDGLVALNRTANKKLRSELTNAGVALVEHRNVVDVTATGVLLDSGDLIPADFVVGAAGARAQDWLAETGLTTHNGYLAVDQTLRSSDPAVFASGDCAELTHAPRPKAGVFAVRAAPILLNNLRASVSGGRMRPYLPQSDYLKLVSLGGKRALAERFGTAYSGSVLWRWKDHIDRTFMARFKDLPAMGQPALPSDRTEDLQDALGPKPMCGGCGAKVGRGALRDALRHLPRTDRPDIESVAGDDAAIIVTGGTRQVMTTDHLRAFWDDPVVMTRIAAVHALGDIWAMGAKPQAATATIILPKMTAALQARTMSEIMEAAQSIMGPAGAAIVGGHSSLGEEFTVGFGVTGLCTDRQPITLEGAREGDAIILTKPIGSGVVMAAAMSGEADGATVAAALDLMQQDQAAASALLGSAHAMTDVTGFGLAGHLAGICEASGVGAELDLSRVPVMQGALSLSERGVRSTLYPDNRAGAGPVFGASGAKADLLFDPQTAGGLLAAVDAKHSAAVLDKLGASGCPAAMIGRFVKGDPVITVI